jgi:uncharacterized protein (DUF1684 family)
MKLKLISLLILIALVATASNNPIDSAYQQSFDKWKAEQVNDLKTNWLVLAGLFWLKPGDNSFGSDSASAILFPKGPAHAGVFTLQGEDVTAKFSPDAHAVIDGKPATNQTLLPDSSGKRTIVEMGSLRFYVIKRGARLGIRLKDLDSEAARNFHDLVFFPLDLNYRVTAKWVPSDGKKTVDVPTVLGDVNPTPVTGTAVFTLNGQQFQLTDLGGDPSKGLFIVFNDLTSKTETYPGGRFLDTDPVVNGTVVLDFNRAYNPPCAVTPYATCPLAPKENRLTIALPVGEKYDHAHAHH